MQKAGKEVQKPARARGNAKTKAKPARGKQHSRGGKALAPRRRKKSLTDTEKSATMAA